MKYEKPKLIEVSEVADTYGDCMDGSAVTDTCAGGVTVEPGCIGGGLPTVACEIGTNVGHPYPS